MSGIIETLLKALEDNTAALNANTAALGKAPAAAATTTTKATTTKAEKAEKVAPKNTVEKVKAAAVKVKEKFGSAAAKELIKTVGLAAELKDIKPENYDAFVDACETQLNAEPAEEQKEDDL